MGVPNTSSYWNSAYTPLAESLPTTREPPTIGQHQSGYLWGSSSVWQPWAPAELPKTPTRTPPGFDLYAQRKREEVWITRFILKKIYRFSIISAPYSTSWDVQPIRREQFMAPTGTQALELSRPIVTFLTTTRVRRFRPFALKREVEGGDFFLCCKTVCNLKILICCRDPR